MRVPAAARSSAAAVVLGCALALALLAPVASASCSFNKPALTAEARLARRSLELAAAAASSSASAAAASSAGGRAARDSAADPAPEREYRTFDGFFNNLGAPTLGGHDFQLLRQLPPAYADNVQTLSNPDGPNPLDVSRQTMTGPSGTESLLNRTVTLVHFGQHLAEELINAMPTHCTSE